MVDEIRQLQEQASGVHACVKGLVHVFACTASHVPGVRMQLWQGADSE